MDTTIVIGGVLICIFSLMAYFVIHIFAPEWLGMTGKAAKKNMDQQKHNPEENPVKVKDFFSK